MLKKKKEKKVSADVITLGSSDEIILNYPSGPKIQWPCKIHAKKKRRYRKKEEPVMWKQRQRLEVMQPQAKEHLKPPEAGTGKEGIFTRAFFGCFGFFFFFLWVFRPCRTASGMFFPRPGIEPMTPEVEARSLNHWTTREFPTRTFRGNVALLTPWLQTSSLQNCERKKSLLF